MPDATHTSPMALVVDEDDTAPGSALAPTLEVAAARTKLPECGFRRKPATHSEAKPASVPI